MPDVPVPDTHAVWYYPRGHQTLQQETVLGDGLLRWAYQDASLPWYKCAMFHNALISQLMGWWCNSRLSRGKIMPTITKLAMDPTEFRDPVDSFTTFNAFFTRHLRPEARPCDPSPTTLASPADARVLVFPRLSAGQAMPVKGAPWTAAALLDRPAPEYEDGMAMILRLCPADYHRFHYPCAGRITERRAIPGYLHSVNPMALATGLNIFPRNYRTVTMVEHPQWGRIALVAVGAFGVGSIVATHQDDHCDKLTEMGYFAFGGSTLIMLLQGGRATWSEDLVAASAEGFETLVKMGQSIALLNH
jgi:phosphatidylserine decarboxylase